MDIYRPRNHFRLSHTPALGLDSEFDIATVVARFPRDYLQLLIASSRVTPAIGRPHCRFRGERLPAAARQCPCLCLSWWYIHGCTAEGSPLCDQYFDFIGTYLVKPEYVAVVAFAKPRVDIRRFSLYRLDEPAAGLVRIHPDPVGAENGGVFALGSRVSRITKSAAEALPN